MRKRRRLAWLWLALVIMAIDDPCAKNNSLRDLSYLDLLRNSIVGGAP